MRGIVGQQSCLIPNRLIPAVGGSDLVMTGVHARQPKQQQNDFVLPSGCRHFFYFLLLVNSPNCSAPAQCLIRMTSLVQRINKRLKRSPVNTKAVDWGAHKLTFNSQLLRAWASLSCWLSSPTTAAVTLTHQNSTLYTGGNRKQKKRIYGQNTTTTRVLILL